MESPALAFFTVLGTVFISSFIFLVILCRYKNLRRNATRYVKKLARSELRGEEIEIVEETSRGGTGLVSRFLRQTADERVMSDRCVHILELISRLDLTSTRLSPTDIQKIRAIIQMAQSITEDSDDWSCLEGREKSGLLEKSTVGLLQRVSSAMVVMEARLAALKESSGQELNSSCSYQNSLII